MSLKSLKRPSDEIAKRRRASFTIAFAIAIVFGKISARENPPRSMEKERTKGIPDTK